MYLTKSRTAVLAALTAMIVLLSGCGGNTNGETSANSSQSKGSSSAKADSSSANVTPKSETYFIFDTVVTVKIYDNKAEKQNFEDIRSLLEDIDSKISRTSEVSEISKVNKASGQAPVKVSADTFELVSKALDYARRTDGQFDPAIGNLVTLWNIGHEGAHVPPADQIEKAQKLCDYRKIQMKAETNEIYLEEAGMSIDLGSIGKGYAADVIADYITGHGFKSAIIDLGGNVFAVGQKLGGKNWTIGIQDPDKERGNPIGNISVDNKTIVTSGIYERFFIENGKLYQHIINPKTGYPVDNNLSSVTIVTDRSADADALSTTTFVLGVDEGLKFVENIPNTEALFITKDKKLYATSGFKQMLKKTNDDYTFAN
ncbi:thiamine biosynthesis protein ApbE [Paenibacillus sp. CAA11]|uniref:FAD:protein FMN transferase n=1 Tax=Paenibacillus sp. CAA11 TaxID=1532905 RepID=UPI000D3BD2EC|nr:FAD:protein FMN transferase [Paenibacillus sp. CAA11]AWB43236.1 thiamine biosynthesis protein ApbE [Paenibacillus sp. CAA11]